MTKPYYHLAILKFVIALATAKFCRPTEAPWQQYVTARL